ncbi:contactin-associated protein-like 5 [Clytia hemisphaerica]|uniref:Uncharacterized protein n=1 Tax=Clytia hemisphaerica TaxID=252671 RepID=A0A7M5UXG2_9CNID
MALLTAYVTILIIFHTVTMVMCNQQSKEPIMKFNGEQDLTYLPSRRQVYQNPYVNKLEFKFRTIHPSGVLLVMSGIKLSVGSVRQGNVLGVYLVHGYLRYSLTSFNHRKSDALMGNNLNDNQWHHVSIVRTKSLTRIRLDNQTKLHIAPQLFQSFSYDKQTLIGGSGDSSNRKLYQNKISDSKNIESTSIPNLNGCLQLLYIDGRDPVAYYNQGSNRVSIQPPGERLQYCTINDEVESIVGLPKLSSSLKINLGKLNVTFSNSFLIEFSLRTFTQQGTILKTINENEVTFEIYLNLNAGKVTCSLGESLSLPSEILVADGSWHYIRIEINRKEFQLQVDKTIHKTTIAIHSNDIQNLANIVELVGMVGCINSIKIQNKRVDLSHDEIIQRKNIRDACTLLNQCFPNPCLNNGVCRHERTDTTCDCTRNEFYGKHCEKPLYKPSCAVYQKFGLNESSYCLIDLDGSGPLMSFTNLCQMSQQKGQIATIVKHNKADFFEGAYGDSKAFKMTYHVFKYEIDETSLNLLIKNSQTCRQKVLFQCRRFAMKFKSPGDPPNLTWLSNSGTQRFYWGDVPPSTRGCECGLSKSCTDTSEICNCDALQEDWAQDGGYITNKEDLPIRRVTLRGIKAGHSNITIGPLECFGDTSVKVSEQELTEFKIRELLPKACYSLNKKDKLLKAANESIQLKLRSEEPYVTTQTLTPSTKPYSVYVISHAALPVSNIFESENPNDENTFSIYEVILIIIAGFSTMILVVKFILCNIFRRLHGQVTLNHEHNRYDEPAMFPTTQSTGEIGNSSSLNRNYGGINCTKTCVKSPSNYWV